MLTLQNSWNDILPSPSLSPARIDLSTICCSSVSLRLLPIINLRVRYSSPFDMKPSLSWSYTLNATWQITQYTLTTYGAIIVQVVHWLQFSKNNSLYIYLRSDGESYVFCNHYLHQLWPDLTCFCIYNSEFRTLHYFSCLSQQTLNCDPSFFPPFLLLPTRRRNKWKARANGWRKGKKGVKEKSNYQPPIF